MYTHTNVMLVQPDHMPNVENLGDSNCRLGYTGAGLNLTFVMPWSPDDSIVIIKQVIEIRHNTTNRERKLHTSIINNNYYYNQP